MATATRIAQDHDIRSALATVDIMQSVPLVMAAWADPDGHRSDLEAMIIRFESQADAIYLPVTLSLRAMLAGFDGDFRRSARTLAASARACLAQRAVADAALYLVLFASLVSHAPGHHETGATVQGVVAAAFERLGIAPPMDLDAVGVHDPRPALVEELGRDAFEAAHERGRRMSLLDASDYLEEVAESAA